jgi:outer membrane protein assembly factor BamB
VVENGVLFVSHHHMTYSASSGGFNAYVTALDLRTGALFWRSDPLVSNGSNFLVRNGYVICGYGFTAEKDFLFVLDATTGQTVRKIPLRSGPEWLIEKDGKLFVRTYDTNYVFELGASPRSPQSEGATSGGGPGSRFR